MPKSKQQASAAQRREQERQQRLNTNQSNQRRRSRRKAKNNPWPLVAGILVVVVIVVGIFIYLANQPGSNSTANKSNATVFNTLTSLSPSLLSQVGTGNAQNLMKALPANASVPTGSTGKPQVLYMGGEYCPYCAAQRWAVIIALSRFGTFSHPLNQISSSEDNIPTFTFHGGTGYTSKYIDFSAVEMSSQDPSTPLDTPTASQQQLFNTYDAPPYTDAQSKGTIPFLLIGNRYTSVGSYYSPTVLSGQSYQDIVNQIKDPNTEISKGVLGAANYLTAAICQISNNQPSNVCSDPSIQQIQSSLPKASVQPGAGQIGMASSQLAMIVREQDELVA